MAKKITFTAEWLEGTINYRIDSEQDGLSLPEQLGVLQAFTYLCVESSSLNVNKKPENNVT